MIKVVATLCGYYGPPSATLGPIFQSVPGKSRMLELDAVPRSGEKIVLSDRTPVEVLHVFYWPLIQHAPAQIELRVGSRSRAEYDDLQHWFNRRPEDLLE